MAGQHMTASRSNCIIETWRNYRALKRAGARVALFGRESDIDKKKLIHVGWAVYDPVLQVYRPSSYRPIVIERDLPFWQWWRRWLFVGQVQHHDDPPPPGPDAGRSDAAKPGACAD